MLLPGQPSLDTLDDIPWSSLSHAYGKAIDVPDQIRALLHEDAKVRARVIFGFSCNIFHQGTIYPATAAAIPFLIDILRFEGVEDRDQILELLAYLAVGYPNEHYDNFDLRPLVDGGNPLQKFAKREANTWHDEEDDIDGVGVMRDCYAAVAAGCPLYTELLEHENPRIAITASFVLAFLPLHAYAVCPRLWQLVCDDSRHQHVRASALISLSYLQGGEVRGDMLAHCAGLVGVLPAAGAKVPYLVAVAAYCLLRDSGWEAPDESRKHLIQIIEACLESGIEAVPCAFYEQRKIPKDNVESGEEYYEAYLAPQAHFPWNIEAAIKHHVRQRLKKKQR